MHPNPVYRSNDQSGAIKVARDRGFGVLTAAGPDGVLAAHIPFIAEPTRIAAHLVRSNPLARLIAKAPVEALLIVSGPDGYISPDWYGIEDQVPTWNYVAVHLRGVLRALPDKALRPHLEQLSAFNETRLPGKTPWTLDKNKPETLARLMRMIVPVELSIRSTDATHKFSQNKALHARFSAADQVSASPVGHERAELARLMRDWEDL